MKPGRGILLQGCMEPGLHSPPEIPKTSKSCVTRRVKLAVWENWHRNVRQELRKKKKEKRKGGKKIRHLQMETRPLLPLGTWYFARAAQTKYNRLSCLPNHPNPKHRKEKKKQ